STNRSTRAAEQLDFAPIEVNRVNGGEALAEETQLMQQLDRPAAIFVEAGLHLGRLLRDVHVNGAPAGFSQPLEPGTRDGSHAVRCKSNGSAGIAGEIRGELLRRVKELLHVGLDEAALLRILRSPVTRSCVADVQENNPQAHIARRLDDPLRQLVPIGVLAPSRVAMKVVELAYRGDSRLRHFQECLARRNVKLLGTESRGDLVHALAPRPERVRLLAGGAELGAAAEQPLKRVRVHVDLTR